MKRLMVVLMFLLSVSLVFAGEDAGVAGGAWVKAKNSLMLVAQESIDRAVADALRLPLTGGTISGGLVIEGTASAVRILGYPTAPPNAIDGKCSLDIWGNYVIVGADLSANTRTNATTKGYTMLSPHYTNASKPVVVFNVANSSTNNILSLGGNNSAFNAVTAILFTTAPNVSSVGSEAARFNSAGELLIATSTDAGAYKLQLAGDMYTTGNLYVPTQYSVYAGSVEGLRVTATGNTLFGTTMIASSTGWVWDNDLDTGCCSNGANVFIIKTGGNSALSANTSALYSWIVHYFSADLRAFSSVDRFDIRNLAASSTTPTYSWGSDILSGLGRFIAGQPSMVAGGVEAQRWTATQTILMGQVRLASSTGLKFSDGTTQITAAATVAYDRYTTFVSVATTTFTPGFSYASNTVAVYCGGILQELTADYTEDSSTVVTFASIVATGTRVTIMKR